MLKYQNARIIGTGSYLPQRKITNDELSKLVDTNDQWITDRTGIKSRFIVEKEETAATIGAAAAKNAIDSSNILKEEIDMINLGGPNAIIETKRLVHRKPKASLGEDFEECAEWSLRMFQSVEGAEGMAAFREKRKASWVQE